MSAALVTLIWFGDAHASQSASPDRTARREKAGVLFEQSRSRYQEGRFEEAAQLLEDAYKLDPAPTLLYNLARAHENAGNLPAAVDAYERYLREDPDAQDRPAIARRVENLKSQIREREALERAASQRNVAEPKVIVSPPPPAEPNPLPWVIAGVGVAGVGVGVAFGVLAQSRRDQALEEPIQKSAETLDAQAANLATAANIAYAAGGALAVTGIIWGIIEVTTNAPPPVAQLLPTSTGLAIAGRF